MVVGKSSQGSRTFLTVSRDDKFVSNQVEGGNSRRQGAGWKFLVFFCPLTGARRAGGIVFEQRSLFFSTQIHHSLLRALERDCQRGR